MSVSPESLQQTWARLAATQSRFLDATRARIGGGAPPDMTALLHALSGGLAADAESFKSAQARYYQEQLALWLEFFGTPSERPPAPATDDDPRFKAPEWRDIPWFDYLRRSYLLSARWLTTLIATAKTDPATQRKLRFHIGQFLDAAAPSNFPATNPEALKLAMETGGASLAAGLENLLADADKGRVSMTDETAFAVGRNLALTEGAVVYRNELFELMQYRPLTTTVHERALLIVPPCINKYYILDLQPENSFVRYAVEQGLTVFMISWRNIPPSLGRTTWDDYLQHGVIRAIEVARAICGTTRINTLGFCVGGTLLACALAVLRARRKRPAASLTLLATMLDFTDPGDISVYVDRAYVERCDETFRDGGIFPGAQLAQAFASLRANDLVWRYVVNNYLKGRTPPAFDLLYWNSDSANLPGPMYAYYVRHMYLENALREPGRLAMCGAPVDLGRIELPSYVLATAEDHIVPWATAYASAGLLGSAPKFVLGASGHIAGVINPAAKNRRSYRTGKFVSDHRAWLEKSVEHAGSWWPHWLAWVAGHSGERVPAPLALGNAKYPALEPAPGRYVGEPAERAHTPTMKREEGKGKGDPPLPDPLPR